jgi:hypothetical protein
LFKYQPDGDAPVVRDSRRLGRKGSYFFVIDACIATIVIVGTLLVLYGSHTYKPSATQSFAAADNFLGYLASTEIGSFDDPQVRSWFTQGLLNDTHAPLLRQLAALNVSARNSEARTLANLTLGAVPPQIGVDLRIAGQSYASRGTDTQSAAAVTVVAKRIVVVRTGAASAAQPVVIEVRTWQ